MLPVAAYVMRKIHSEFYPDVFFPKLIVAQIPFLAMTMAPWFILEITPGDYYLLATQVQRGSWDREPRKSKCGTHRMRSLLTPSSLLAMQVWSTLIYPVLFATYIWPPLCGKPKSIAIL